MRLRVPSDTALSSYVASVPLLYQFRGRVHVHLFKLLVCQVLLKSLLSPLPFVIFAAWDLSDGKEMIRFYAALCYMGVFYVNYLT